MKRALVVLILISCLPVRGTAPSSSSSSAPAPDPAPSSPAAPGPAPAPGPGATPRPGPVPKVAPAKPAAQPAAAAAAPATPAAASPAPAPSPAAQQAPANSQNSSAASVDAQRRADLIRKREQWFHDQRAYPFQQIPAGAFQKAIEQRDQMRRQQRSGIRLSAPIIGFPGDGVWHAAGPQPTDIPASLGSFPSVNNVGFPTVSGRVTALAVDPSDATGNTVYLGGAAGGVWKTTDGGATWTPLTDSQPSLAVSSIAIDPNNHLNIYVGTGEENFNRDAYTGAGILKSTDGGITWTQLGANVFANILSPSVGGAKIGAIAVQPGNSNIVLAAVTFVDNGTMGGIYRSTDGGATWTQVGAGPVGAAATAVVFEPTIVAGTTAIAYAAMGDAFGGAPNGIYKSTDSGQTWTKLSSGLPASNLGRIQLAYAPSTSGAGATLYAAIADSSTSSSDLLLVGGNPAFFQTTNGGTTWTQKTATPDFCFGQCFYDVAIAVHPTNPNFIVVGGSAYSDNSTTLFRSTDGGATWTTDSTTPSTDFTIGSTNVRPHVDTHALAFTANGASLYTGDDGGAWRTDNPAATSPDNPLWVGLNGSAATPSLALSQFYPGTASSVSDDNYGAGGTQDNDIQIFSGTLDWALAPACGDGGYTAFDPTTPTTIYAGCNITATPKIMKSVFYGQSTPGPNPAPMPSFQPAETEITNSGDTMGFIPPLVLDPNTGFADSNATTLFFGTCRLWKSTNSATSSNGIPAWTALTGDLTGTSVGLPCNTPQYISAIDALTQKSSPFSKIVFAGTSNGKVWRSSNGTTFTAIDNSSLPPRHVTATRLLPSDTTGNTVYVTFSGFGSCAGCDGKGHVFLTTNATAGPATWTDISGDLPDAPVNDILLDITPGPVTTLYIATDVGVFSCNATATPNCPNWTILGDPLPNSPAISLSLRPTSRILRVGTHGRGMYDIQLTNVLPSAQPFLSGLTPAAVMAGAGATQITVTGVNFSPNTQVVENFGVITPFATTFVSTTQLTATLPAALLANGSIIPLGLVDPLGADPGTLPFTVMNPIPVLTGVSVTGGQGVIGEPVTITVTGTSLVSSTQLTITDNANNAVFATANFGTVSGGGTQDVFTIPANLSAGLATGAYTVTILNPLPGGGAGVNSGGPITLIAQTNSEITFNPTFVPFTTAAGTVSAVMNVQLTNVGPKSLSLMGGSAVISGLNASDFSIVTPTGTPAPPAPPAAAICAFVTGGTAATIASNGSCWFGLTFTAPGTAMAGSSVFASLTVSDGDPDTDDESVSLSGTVSGPVLEFNIPVGSFFPTVCVVSGCTLAGVKATVDFGSVPEGTPSEMDGSVINASGTGPIMNTSLSITGANAADFTIVPPSASACSPLAGSFTLTSSCNVGVAFKPSSAAAETATLVITSSNAGTVNVPLQGTGVVPTISSISPEIVATNGPAFTLTVNGTNFVLGSVVNFSGSARLTTFVSATKLLASIPAGDLLTAGGFAITVTNPNGGGTSEPKTLIVSAAPIATNDDFNFAVNTSATPFVMTENTTFATTNTNGHLDPTSANFPGGCVPGTATLSGDAKSVWFKFVAPATGIMVANTRYSSYPTILSVWTGTPGSFVAVGNGCASGNISGTAPLQSAVSVGVSSGTTYYIMVSDATASAATGGVLTLSVDFGSAAPANDPFSGATVITAPATGAVYSNTVNTVHATPNTGGQADPAPPCAPAGAVIGGIENSVWYSFTPGSSTPVTADTLTSHYDTILSVWTGSPGSFTQVACNDNAGSGASQVSQSQVSFNANASTTYYFMVSSVIADGGTLNFHLSLTAPPAAGATLTIGPPNNPANFPNTQVGTASAPLSAPVTNNGPGSVTITSINTISGNNGDFIGAPFTAGDCSDGGNGHQATMLAVSASCNLRGIFTPTTTGARTLTVQVTAQGAANSPTLVLNGTGTAATGPATLTLTPNPLNFSPPDWLVGSTSGTMTSTLKNTGTGSAAITKIQTNGANSNDFPQAAQAAGDCAPGVTLTTSGAGSSCTYRSAFSPSINGAESATTSITATNAAASPLTLTENGTGVSSASGGAIVVKSGSDQTTSVSTNFGGTLVALVTDGSGNPFAGVVVTFTAPGSGASGTFAGSVNTATTDSNGLATSKTFTANGTAGSYGVTASVSGIATPATFVLTNAGPATMLTATGGSGRTASVNTPFAQPLLAMVTDASFLPVPGVTVTWTVPGSGASATFAGGKNTAVTDAGGVATSAALTANGTAGAYTVTASATGLTSVNYTMNNISPPQTISTIAGGGTNTSPHTCSEPFLGGIFNGKIYIADCTQIFSVASNGARTLVGGNGTIGYSGDGGPATQASFNFFTGAIFVDGSGNVFVADGGNNRIREIFASTGIIQTVAGNGLAGFAGNSGLAVNAELNGPSGVYVDASGNIFISDSNNNEIRKVTPDGKIAAFAGTTSCSYSGDNGQATSASLCFPEGIWLDGSGNVYVADGNNSVIREINAATNVITTVAGNVNLGGGYSGDGGLASNAALNFPSNVYVDGPGNIYIPDSSNNVVRLVNAPTAPNPGVINTIAGKGTYGFAGDGGLATGAELAFTWDIITDGSGNVFVSDDSGVREFKAGGNILTPTGLGNTAHGFSGDGAAATSAQLFHNTGMTRDPNGNLFIVDQGNYRIREVTAADGKINTVAGNGTEGSTGDTGAATAAEIDPNGPIVEHNGTIYFTENSAGINGCRVRAFTVGGNINTVAGGATCGTSVDPGLATSAQLMGLKGIAVDSTGNVYISQDGAHPRVRKFTVGGNINTVAGNGTAGYAGDGGPATSAEVRNPKGLFVDGSGNLYIADANNFVIREVFASNQTINTVAGKSIIGGGYAGDGGPATSAAISSPNQLFVDGSGDIFFSQAGGFPAVREVVAATGNIQTVAGNGIFGFAGDGAAATTAEFEGPSSVVGDTNGNLYINDTFNGRVRFVNAGTANLALTPNPLTFATTVVGNKSATLFVTLKNNGPGSVTVSNINLTAGNTGDFIGQQQAGDCSDGSNGVAATTLAVNASCNVHGAFTPTVAGLRQATLTITATGAANAPSTVLQGTGTAAAGLAVVSASPNPINFPDQNVGTTSQAITLVLTNTGTGSATLTNFKASGSVNAFAIVGGNCTIGTVLAPSGSPGNTCNIRETFTPSGTGPFQAIGEDTFTNVSANPLSVPANGNGATASTIAVSSGSGQAAALNSAFAAPLVALVTDAGSNPIEGVLVTFTAPAQTGPSGTFAGSVNTATTDKNGLATSQTFTANNNVGGYNVVATAPGVAAGANFGLTNASGATLSFTGTTSPNTYDYGSVTVGTTVNAQVALKNNGPGSVTITGIAFGANPGNDFKQALPTAAGDCALLVGVANGLTSGSSCNLRGTFTPSAVGLRSTTLTTTATGAANSPIVLNLQGTGTPGPAVSVKVETKADGTGTLVPAQNVASGSTVTGFAISRDAGGNFVANVAATWSLASKTGGVVSGDLVPAADNKSATFTGHLAGTAAMHAVVSGLTSTDSGTLTVVAGGATTVRVETKADGTGTVVPAQNVASGSAVTGFAIGRDASGNFVANVAATWSLANPTGGVVSGDLVAAADSKSATFTGHLAGTAAMHAVVSLLTSTDSGTLTVVAGAATAVRVETKADGTGTVVPAQNVTSGSTVTGFAISRDASGNFIANVAATWSLANPTGGVVNGDLVASADKKSATFTGHLVGTAAIHAVVSGSTSTDSGTLTVVAGAATAVKVETKADGTGTVVPAQNVVSGSLVTGFAISRDAAGNFIANAAATWSLANPTGGVVSGDLVAAADTKSATFTGHLVGTAAIHAVVSGLTSTDSGTLTVTVGAAAKLAFTTQPGGGTSATAWAQQPAVTVQDAAGNTVTSSSASITLAITAGSGAAGAALTCTTNTLSASSGVATFAGCKIDKAAANYKLTATTTVAGVSSATSNTFAITAGAASGVVVNGGSNQSAPINTQFVTAFKVTVTDASGNPVPGVQVTFTAPAESGPSGTFAGAAAPGNVIPVTTDATGVATAPAFTANGNTSPGGTPYQVTVAVGSVMTNIGGLVNLQAANNFTNGGGDGQWTTVTNWSLGHVPTSIEVATDTGGLNVTLSSGAQTPAAITFNKGGTLTISGGSLTLAGASAASGLTISGGTLTGNAALSVAGATTVSSGTISGSGTITLNGALNWSGGTVAMTQATGAINITSGPTTLSGTPTFTSGTINNGAVATMSAATTLNMGGSSALVNQASGTWNVTTGGLSAVVGANPSFSNAGTYSQTGGPAFFFTGIAFNGSGAANISGGTLNLNGGGSYSGTITVGAGATLSLGGLNFLAMPGSTIAGSGTVLFTGGLSTIAGAYNITGQTTIGANGADSAVVATFNSQGAASTANLTLNAGALSGTIGLLVNGTMTWAGGTLNNTGATNIAATGTLNLTGTNSTPKQSGSALLITGTANINAGLDIGGNSLLQVNANGIFNLNGDFPIASVTVAGNSMFSNSGTVTKTAGTGAAGGGFGGTVTATNTATGVVNANSGALNFGGPFSNAGAVKANSGTINFGTSFTQTGGTTTLALGTTIASTGTMNINGGTLHGSGNIMGSVSNAGTLKPGNSPGTLTISGTYTQTAAGTLDIELDGTAAGQFSVLNVGGAATLNGTLAVTLGGGFAPAVGNMFQIINFASSTGQFSSETGLSQGNVFLQVVTNATNVTLNGILSTVSLSTNAFDFGGVRINTSSGAKTVATLTNSTNATVTINTITASGTNAAEFTLQSGAGDCANGTMLPATTSCNLSYAFKPGALGARGPVTVTITDNRPGQNVLTLNGAGTAPAVTFSPNPVPAFSQGVGTTSAVTNVAVTNSGTDVLNITSIAATGTDAGQYVVTSVANGATPACPLGASQLAAGSSCNVGVQFAPTSTGAHNNASLTVKDDVPGSASQSDALSGNGIAPAVTFSPNPVTSFGSVRVNTTSAVTNVTITNSGTDVLNITSIAATGTDAPQYVVTSVANGATAACSLGGSALAVGSSCNVGVQFKPTSAGAHNNASLTVNDSNVPGSAMQSDALRGTGTAPAVTIVTSTPNAPNQPAVAFGIQDLDAAATTQTITVTNSGTDTLNLAANNAVVLGDTVNFSVVAASTTCTNGKVISSTAPNNTCVITVSFKPTLAQAFATNVTLTDDANAVAGTQQAVGVTGTGATPAASVTPNPLPALSAILGNSTTGQVTISDTGTGPLTISAISMGPAVGTGGSGDFTQTNTCGTLPAVVQPGGNCVVTVKFAPTATGARAAVLTVTDDDSNKPGSMQSDNLSGTGVDFMLAQHTPGTVQVTAGTPMSVQIDLTTIPANTALPADVNYACAFTTPASLAGASCAMNPTKTTAGSTSGSTMLMLTTTANLVPAPRQRTPWTPAVPWTVATMLAGITMLFLATRRRIIPLPGRAALATVALLLIAAGGLTGCTTSMKSAPPTPTPKGPATVMVTATSGSDVKNVAVNINVM